IQDALNAKAAEAAERVDVPTARPRSLRRAAPVLGAVAAVAAVVVTVSLVATSHKTTHTATPRPHGTGCGAAATENTTLRFDFRVDVPAGFTTSPAAICSRMQQQYVDVKGDGIHVGSELNVVFPEGTVTVFRAGAFDATAAQKARPMTVQGH